MKAFTFGVEVMVKIPEELKLQLIYDWESTATPKKTHLPAKNADSSGGIPNYKKSCGYTNIK